jgi:hypothetical protein|nr:MAG TPA: hypothetical protein [Caudoviricetes sp.]
MQIFGIILNYVNIMHNLADEATIRGSVPYMDATLFYITK